MSGSGEVAHHEIDVGDGLRLHAERSGTGRALVLLHGFTGSTATWAPLRTELGSLHTVVAVDLPGHGRSSAPTDPDRYGLDRFADDLVRVLDALDLERVALLGYSMGGRAALRVALRHADRLDALVLESASPGIADEARRETRIAADRAMADRIERDGVAAFVREWERLPLWKSQRALPTAVRERLRAERDAADPVGLANSLRGAGAGVDPAVSAGLPALRLPTLLVAGALDLHYVALAHEMAAALPSARVEIVADAGHAVHLERPAAFLEAVSAFLRPM